MPTTLAKDATRGAFFRRYAAAREGILRLGLMRLGGRAIAMQLAVECGERFWPSSVANDSGCSSRATTKLSRLLPGISLSGVLVPSKQMWSPVERPCVTPRASPYRPRGLVLLGSDAARLALSRLRKLAHSRRAVPIPRREVSP
jgi:hypothetical protein